MGFNSTVPRFFHPGPFGCGKEITLSPDQSHHLSRVLRVAAGAQVCVFDGEGRIARVTVISAKARATMRIDSVEISGRSPITLCFGIPKTPALEFILRRCTEVGVASFQPLVTKHSLTLKAFPGDRWKKILIEVCKQCEQNHVPKVVPPVTLGRWWEQRNSDRALVVCHERERGGQPLCKEAEFDLLIGPEGGWSEEETEEFLRRGAQFFGLGIHRLRMETAALVALALLREKTASLRPRSEH